MIQLYILIGILWTLYVFNKRKNIKQSQRDHWFPVMLFSMMLWPFFMYFAYERGVLQDDLQKLNKKTLTTNKQ
jgi:hypothetical protein